MDNFSFDITANGNLEDWLRLCMAGRHVTGWHSDQSGKGSGNGRRLVLYWVEPPRDNDGYQAFPAKADATLTAQMVEAWLAGGKWGTKPDHDGDTGQGFRIYNEGWGMIGSDYRTFIAIEPAWALYGK